MTNQNSLIRKVFVLILIIAGISVTGLSAQTNMTTAAPASDEESAKKVHAFLSQWDKNDLPGGAVGVVKDGRLVYKRAFGSANLDYDIPNSPATLFNLASVSKPFTATSIALLAEQGKLSLDDDIRKYVPEIPKYEDTVTIRHLIHHTSGLREYQALVLFSGLGTDNAYSEKSILNILARQKNLSFKPGAKYQYSNSGYFLLGVIVRRVSGKSLRQFADETIFKPLGMKNTRIYDNRFEVIKNRAIGYRFGPDKNILVRSSLYDLVGAGGVLSSVEDLSLWVQNYFEPKVGTKELISMMTTPATLNNGKKITYAFGMWRNQYKGLPTLRHSGNMTGFRAQILSFPEQKFAVIALSNNMSVLPSAIVDKLADIYLDGQFKPASASIQKNVTEGLPPAISLSEKDALRYAGIYAHVESGRFFKLSIKDGKLVNGEFFKKEVPVTAISENRIVVVDGNGMTDLNVVFDKAGRVGEIRILNDSGTPDVFVPVKPPADSPEQLSEYIGTFYSEEFNADHRIELKGKNLVLQIGESFEAPLTPAFTDAFTTANGQVILLFNRNDKGMVSGFVFNSGIDEREVKDINFARRSGIRPI